MYGHPITTPTSAAAPPTIAIHFTGGDDGDEGDGRGCSIFSRTTGASVRRAVGSGDAARGASTIGCDGCACSGGCAATIG
jgi:hypothetical protein